MLHRASVQHVSRRDDLLFCALRLSPCFAFRDEAWHPLLAIKAATFAINLRHS